MGQPNCNEGKGFCTLFPHQPGPIHHSLGKSVEIALAGDLVHFICAESDAQTVPATPDLQLVFCTCSDLCTL